MAPVAGDASAPTAPHCTTPSRDAAPSLDAASEPVLEVRQLRHCYSGSDLILSQVDLTVQPGELLVIVGPSGCGKTTLLRTIAGLEMSCGGSIHLLGRLLDGDGTHVPAEKRGIGVVFQDYALFPHLDVLRNVMFGLHRLPRRDRKQAARNALQSVGMADLEHRRPHQLSGGQQQRVALARAVAPGCSLVLLDEPFSSLDAELRHSTRHEVRSILQQAGASAILVTHDQEEALSMADRIAVMEEGRLVQTGRPDEVYNHPQTSFVARFLGRTNLIFATAQGETADTPLGRIRLSRPSHGEVILSIRPESLDLVPVSGTATCDSIAVGRVISREFKGHDITFRVEVAKQVFLAHTDYRCRAAEGDTVQVRVLSEAATVRGA